MFKLQLRLFCSGVELKICLCCEVEKVDCGIMTYNTRSAKHTETSQQGSMRSLQPEETGTKESTDEKIDKLQEAIEMLVSGMHSLMSMKPTKLEEMLDEEEETPVIHKDKGVFRNPTHLLGKDKGKISSISGIVWKRMNMRKQI